MFLRLDLFDTFLPILLKGHAGHGPAEMFDEITSYKKNLLKICIGIRRGNWECRENLNNEYYGNIYGLVQSN